MNRKPTTQEEETNLEIMSIGNRLRDSRLFTRLAMSDENNHVVHDGSIHQSSWFRFGSANELRVGKYVMIGGVPCRIRELHRAAPGKHGHAKLRTVGIGLLDAAATATKGSSGKANKKKRETIFGSHQTVMIPSVEVRSQVLCKISKGGYVVYNNDTRDLPPVLAFAEEGHDDTDDDQENDENGIENNNFSASGINRTASAGTISKYVALTILITCGHFQITSVRSMSEKEWTQMAEKSAADRTSSKHGTDGRDADTPAVLSKKDQRKQKKLLRKQALLAKKPDVMMVGE